MDKQKRLALLRIKRHMPAEFTNAGLKYPIHSIINGITYHSRESMDKQNALMIFYTNRRLNLGDRLVSLRRMAHTANTSESVRDQSRKRIAIKILKALNRCK